MARKKSLVRNSFFNVIYRGFTALFPLLTTSYISRTLLPERVGLVSYANTIVLYFTTVASLGIPNYGVKEISKSGDNIEERSKTFAELFTINAISTSICIVAFYSLVNLAPYFGDKRPVMNTMGLLLIFNLINVDWFYQGIEEYELISVRSIIVKAAAFVAMLLFVHSPSDYLIYAVILSFATTGNYIFNMAVIHRYVRIRRFQLELKKHLAAVFILLASTLATELYTTLDTVMLEYFDGTASVAFYSNAVKIVRMVYTLVIAMIAPLYPRIAFYLQNEEKNESDRLLNRAYKIVILLGIPAVIGLCLTADQIVRILFGPEYMKSVSVLRIASILVLIFSVAYTLGHIVLMAAGEEKYILRASIAGAVVNAAMNFTLIPVMQENGAIIASVISELTVTAILVYHGRKNFRLVHSRKFYLTVAAASAVMAFTAYGIKILTGRLPVFLSFICVVAAAVIVYAGLLILMKNEAILEVKERLLQKFRNKQQNH